MNRYKTQGVCATEIVFDVQDGKITHLEFIKGCPGNLQAISKLVVGMPAATVIEKLKGNLCQNGTSCADQLAKALEAALAGAV